MLYKCFTFIYRSVSELIESMKKPILEDSDSSEDELMQRLVLCKKKVSSQSTSQRFRWNSEMIDLLLKGLASLKTVYEYKGIDSESDLIKVYSEIRQMMAEEFIAFGPLGETPIEEGLSTEELATARAQNINEKKQIKAGYERVKQKVKDLRQEYRKAVTEGVRSGSGKLVTENNFKDLQKVWGGSPAAALIENPVCSSISGTTDGHIMDGEEDQNDIVQDTEQNLDNEQTSLSNEESQMAGSLRTAQFVDKKRKQMEKNLSASQRDKLYLDMARDELNLQENMVKGLVEATNQSNKAFESISKSIESVGKSIGDGLGLLANAISNWNQQPQSLNISTPLNYRIGIPSSFNGYPGNFQCYSNRPQQLPNTSQNFENSEIQHQEDDFNKGLYIMQAFVVDCIVDHNNFEGRRHFED